MPALPAILTEVRIVWYIAELDLKSFALLGISTPETNSVLIAKFRETNKHNGLALVPTLLTKSDMDIAYRTLDRRAYRHSM